MGFTRPVSRLTDKTADLLKRGKQIRIHRVVHRHVQDHLTPRHRSGSQRDGNKWSSRSCQTSVCIKPNKTLLVDPTVPCVRDGLYMSDLSGPSVLLCLLRVALQDADHSLDFEVPEDAGVHELFLVTHIQKSCDDLHRIRQQVFQLLRESRNAFMSHSSPAAGIHCRFVAQRVENVDRKTWESMPAGCV